MIKFLGFGTSKRSDIKKAAEEDYLERKARLEKLQQKRKEMKEELSRTLRQIIEDVQHE